MKHNFSTSGALRARTRAFLCALALTLFSSATAFAGFDGDATSQSTGRTYTNKPFTNAEVTRTGTLYTFHKTYDTDNDGNALTYTITEHFEFYTAAPIPVGGKVYMLQCDRSGDANTVRSYDPATATGSYYRAVPKSSGTTVNYYWTQSKEIFGVPKGLGIYHKAENEWLVVNGLANSNNWTYSNSYGDGFPECTITFEVGGEPWNHGSLATSSQTGNWGIGIMRCSATPESGYKFGIWSNGLYYTSQSSFLPLENITLTAYFVPESAESRTVTVTADASDGTAGVYYRAARGISILVVETSATVFEGVPVTLVATQTGSNPFDHWEDEGGNTIAPANILSSNTVNGVTTTQVIVPTGKNTTYTAVFAPAAPVTPTYEVAASVSPAGAGSVTGTGTYDEGYDVTLTATPANRRWQFVRWTESSSTVGTAASYDIDDIDDDHTLVAVFEEIPVTIADNESSSYYASTLSTFSATMDFRLMRTFKAGMWNTVCFPFDLTSAQRGNSDMSGATFYTLTSVTGDAAVGLDFNVTAVTTETMTARTPYLVQFTGADIVNPVFNDVTLAASAFTNNTSGTNVGETSFFGTVHPTSLKIGENSGYLFLGQNNSLYWPNVNNDIRAFRAYFYSGNSTVQAVRPRARIVVKEQTATGNSGISGNSGTSGESARKYLHNGVLVIERDGVKYNAVGQPIE